MKIQLASMVYTGFHNLLDWIYPPVCAGCGEPGYHLCTYCQESIHFMGEVVCQICGGSVKKASHICDSCLADPPPYKAMRNLAQYEGVIRECLHALKYENKQALGGYFSRQLFAIVIREGWQIDMVTPVPLSPLRLQERGYNQAELIARPLAAHLSLTYNPYCLKRVRHTKSQVGLSLEERRDNISAAFKAVVEIVAGKKILLVDDIMTTGATSNACTEALVRANADSVYCLTVARFSKRPIRSNQTIHQV